MAFVQSSQLRINIVSFSFLPERYTTLSVAWFSIPVTADDGFVRLLPPRWSATAPDTSSAIMGVSEVVVVARRVRFEE